MTYGQQPGYGRPRVGGHVPEPGGHAYGYPGGQGPWPGSGGPAHQPSPYGQGGHPVRPYGGPTPYAPPRPYPAAQATERGRGRTPTGGPVTDEDERWAVPAYVGIFVTGVVAPAVVCLAKGGSSRFARFHGVQALNLSIAMTVCNALVLTLTYMIGLTGLLITAVVLAGEFFCVIRAAIGANRCEWYRLPAVAAWPIFR